MITLTVLIILPDPLRWADWEGPDMLEMAMQFSLCYCNWRSVMFNVESELSYTYMYFIVSVL